MKHFIKILLAVILTITGILVLTSCGEDGQKITFDDNNVSLPETESQVHTPYQPSTTDDGNTTSWDNNTTDDTSIPDDTDGVSSDVIDEDTSSDVEDSDVIIDPDIDTSMPDEFEGVTIYPTNSIIGLGKNTLNVIIIDLGGNDVNLTIKTDETNIIKGLKEANIINDDISNINGIISEGNIVWNSYLNGTPVEGALKDGLNKDFKSGDELVFIMTINE